MNKEIYKKNYGERVEKILILTEEVLGIEFESGAKSVFKSQHTSDCCEEVYADFSPLKYYKEEIEGDLLSELVIKQVEGMGFLMCFDSDKIFIPCHNYQNGSYSTNLRIEITNTNKYEESTCLVDVTDCVEEVTH